MAGNLVATWGLDDGSSITVTYEEDLYVATYRRHKPASFLARWPAWKSAR